MANVGYVGIPPFDPSTIAGLELWLKADTLALADGAAISTWADQSGNGNDATQSGSARPLLSTTSFAINGHQTVFFNTSPANQYLNLTTPISGGTWSVLVVMKPYDTPYPMFSISSSGGGSGCPLGPATVGNTFYVGRQDYLGSDGTAGTAPHVLTATSQAATSLLLYVDGVSQTISGVSPSGTSTNFDRLGVQGAGLNYSIGAIGEILVYDSILSGTDRGDVETYLSDKYGL